MITHLDRINFSNDIRKSVCGMAIPLITKTSVYVRKGYILFKINEEHNSLSISSLDTYFIENFTVCDACLGIYYLEKVK